MRAVAFVLGTSLFVGCAAAPKDVWIIEEGPDAGIRRDASVTPPRPDASAEIDLGVLSDASVPDARITLDAALPDAAPLDASADAAFQLDAAPDLGALADASRDMAPAVDASMPTVRNDTCLSATPLTLYSVTTGTLVGATNDYGTGTDCVGTAGPDVAYVMTVAPGAFVSVDVINTTPGFDPSINLVLGPASECAATPRVCYDGSDVGYAGETDTVSFWNLSFFSQQIFIIVESYNSSVGEFTLYAYEE